MAGFVKIHRELTYHALWADKPFTKGQAWIDILLKVNHKPAEILVGNTTHKLAPGQTLWSMQKMAVRWGWSVMKVSRFLDYLEKEQMLRQKRDTKFTTITVVNWKRYQQDDTKTRIKRESNENQTRTNKNEKNDKNELDISTNVDIQKPEYGRADINEALEYFEQINGYKPSKGKMNRFAITRLLKKMQLSDLLRVIKAAKEAQDEDDYAPRVFNFLDLEQKLPNILDYYRRKENSSSNVIMID